MTDFSFEYRIDRLRETKMRHTAEKQSVVGSMDFDDHAIILPPEGKRKIVELMGPSGVPNQTIQAEGFSARPRAVKTSAD